MKEVMNFCDKSTLESFAYIAAISVPIIAIIAGIIAIWQIISSSKVQRRSTAYSLYQQYLKLALENHNLAFATEELKFKNTDEYAKYKWFISSMLLCFEEILISCPKESDWIATINSQLRRHSWHLSQSSSIRAGHWKGPLSKLIYAQIKLFDDEKRGKRDVPRERGEICFRLTS
jgi:hypothetical protein